MSESIGDLVNAAPVLSEDDYAELAVLFRRHRLLQSMFASVLHQATIDAISIKEMDLSTDLGRAQQLQGAVKGREVTVGNFIDRMDRAHNAQPKTERKVPRVSVKKKTQASRKAAPKKRK